MKKDPELLRCYVEENSETAFAELVQRHLPSVYGAALRRVGGDAHLAKDVAQHVFTALAREARTLARRPVLAGWLHTTTRYAASHVVRAERRRHAREEEAHVMQELSTEGLAPDDWGQLRPLLDEAMDGLPERDREAVLLRFFEEQSFAEIGVALRTSEDAARVRVNRALDKLHAALGRRGVKSTVAALGVALANHIGATAVPAGLGAAITGTALIGGSLAGPAAVGGGILAAAGAAKIAIGMAVAAGGLAGGIAWEQHRQTQEWEAQSAVIEAQRHALQAQVEATEARLRQTEQRASEAERDNGELLQAVAAFRSEQAKREIAAKAQADESLNQQRAYQQDLARRRAEKAKASSAVQSEAQSTDAVAEFKRLIQEASELAARAEFQAAIRLYNQAMTTKPRQLETPAEAKQLQAVLARQNAPVELTLVSDGETTVSFAGARGPSRFRTSSVRLPPGNYEILGRRAGYQDVVVRLELRGGSPPPPLTIACTVPDPR